MKYERGKRCYYLVCYYYQQLLYVAAGSYMLSRVVISRKMANAVETEST